MITKKCCRPITLFQTAQLLFKPTVKATLLYPRQAGLGVNKALPCTRKKLLSSALGGLLSDRATDISLHLAKHTFSRLLNNLGHHRFAHELQYPFRHEIQWPGEFKIEGNVGIEID